MARPGSNWIINAVLLLAVVGGGQGRGEAAQLTALTPASGHEARSPSYRLRIAVGELSVGSCQGPGGALTLGFLAYGSASGPVVPGPATPVLSEDNAIPASPTALRAAWAPSQDPAVVEYQYLIRQDSPFGAVVVGWTSVGLLTEVTRAGITLRPGTTYYVGVRAKTAAGLTSLPSYSGGLRISADTEPPTGTLAINAGAAYTAVPTVSLRLAASDRGGVVSQMAFSNDGPPYTPAEPYAATRIWTLSGGDGLKTVSVTFRDAASNWSSPVSQAITLDTTPPRVTIISPRDDAVVRGQ